MLSEHKDSTVRQYQSTWSKFLGCLAKESIDYEGIVLSTVYNFLSAELAESDWAYATIADYRCALVHPLLYALGLDIEGKHRVSFMTGLFQLSLHLVQLDSLFGLSPTFCSFWLRVLVIP